MKTPRPLARLLHRRKLATPPVEPGRFDITTYVSPLRIAHEQAKIEELLSWNPEAVRGGLRFTGWSIESSLGREVFDSAEELERRLAEIRHQ